MRSPLLWFGALIAVLMAIVLGLVRLLGIRVDLLSMGKQGRQLQVNRAAPLVTVSLVSARSEPSPSPIGIWTFSQIYAALGVRDSGFREWQGRYGFDSHGVGSSGENFVPGYPVFSKVAWAHIDPVDLTLEESQALIKECDRLIPSVEDQDVKLDVLAIRNLASQALKQPGTLRFGPP